MYQYLIYVAVGKGQSLQNLMRTLHAFYAFRKILDDGRRMAQRIQVWPTYFLMQKMRPNSLKKERPYRQGLFWAPGATPGNRD